MNLAIILTGTYQIRSHGKPYKSINTSDLQIPVSKHLLLDSNRMYNYKLTHYMKQKHITPNLTRKTIFLLLLLFIVGVKSTLAKTQTYTFTSFASSETVTFDTGINDIKVILSQNTANTAPGWYSPQARLYAGGALTVSSETCTITKIVFTYDINKGTNGNTPSIEKVSGNPDAGTWSTSSKTWTGAANTVTMTTVKSSGNFGFKSITITYEPVPDYIAIEGAPENKVYYTGDKPSAKGLNVIATYNDLSTEDVSGRTTWTFEPNVLTPETKEVIATATYKDKIADTRFNVTVMDTELTYNLVPVENESSVYNVSSDIAINGVTWRVTGNTRYLPWRIGGNGITKVDRNIESQSPVYGTIKRIIVELGNTSGDITLNSLTLSIADNPKYSNATTITKTDVKANSECTFDINPATDAYYKFTFNVTNSKSDNKYYELAGIQFYGFLPTSTIGTAEYATFCLPYNSVVPEGLTAYTATLHNDAIKLVPKKDGIIAAGEGVVLRGNAGTYNFIATAKSIEPTPDNLMIGILKDTPLTAADNAYMLTRHSDGTSMAFRLLTTEYTISANKAYLKLPNNNNARNLFNILWDDNTTGIIAPETKDNMQNDVIYNIAGQKLSATQKGINIIDGKLIIK